MTMAEADVEAFVKDNRAHLVTHHSLLGHAELFYDKKNKAVGTLPKAQAQAGYPCTVPLSCCLAEAGLSSAGPGQDAPADLA